MMLVVALYLIIALFAWGALLHIDGVGKPRKPTTPRQVAVTVAFDAAIIVALGFAISRLS